MTASLWITHHMAASDDYATTARQLVEAVADAQRRHPGQPRRLLLTIGAHHAADGRFDRDATDLMRQFLPQYLARWLTAYVTPLDRDPVPGPCVPQRDDVPDTILVMTPAEARRLLGGEGSV